MSNNILQQALEIQKPKPEQKFTLDEYVLFQGKANSDITTIQLIADGQWKLRTINVDQSKWSATYKFLQSGQRTVEVLGLNDAGERVASDSITIVISPDEVSLLPPERNPVQAGVEVSKLVRLTLEIFDSEGISKRHYDHIAPLDGITLGLGHYPQAQIAGFFNALKDDNNGETLNRLIIRLYEYFQKDDSAWHKLQSMAKRENSSLSTEEVRKAIKSTLLNQAFMSRYSKNCRIECKNNEPDFYHEQENWFVPSMGYALRDLAVVQWQVRYWEHYLLKPSQKKATQAGLVSIPSVIGVASAESSAKSWGTHIAGAKERGYIGQPGSDYYWQWNKHPFLNNPTDEQLESWRLLARWQWYCWKKGKIRNRSRTYFNKFLAHQWKLPTFKGGSTGTRDPKNWNPTLLKMK